MSMKMPYTLEEIMNCKKITDKERVDDIRKLLQFDGATNPRMFAGNKTIYHYQFENMLATKRSDATYPTIADYYKRGKEDELWRQTIQRRRRDLHPDTLPSMVDVFECYRINTGPIVSFKPSTAKYIYNLFSAENILDPTAGWGGRMLGAMLDHKNRRYTGYDTNIAMRGAYQGMIDNICEWRPNIARRCNIIWESCLDADFTHQYDLVLTSPPYSNKEIYENMPNADVGDNDASGWSSDDDYYKSFLLPLMRKLEAETNCPLCINISPKMYKLLTTKYGFPECYCKIDLRQQMGKAFKTKSQDYIYVWMHHIPGNMKGRWCAKNTLHASHFTDLDEFKEEGADEIFLKNVKEYKERKEDEDDDEDGDPETGEVNPNLVYE